jgi:hypothetical protein
MLIFQLRSENRAIKASFYVFVFMCSKCAVPFTSALLVVSNARARVENSALPTSFLTLDKTKQQKQTAGILAGINIPVQPPCHQNGGLIA